MMAVSTGFKRASGLADALEKRFNLQYRSRKRILGEHYRPAQKDLYIAYPNGRACSIAGIEFNSQMLKDLEFDDVYCKFGPDKRWRCWAVKGEEQEGLLWFVTNTSAAGEVIEYSLSSNDWRKVADLPPCPYTGPGTITNYVQRTGVCTGKNLGWFGFRDSVAFLDVVSSIWSLSGEGDWTRLSALPPDRTLTPIYGYQINEAVFVQGDDKFCVALRNQPGSIIGMYSFDGETWESLVSASPVSMWSAMADVGEGKLWGVKQSDYKLYEHDLTIDGETKLVDSAVIDILVDAWSASWTSTKSLYWYLKNGTRYLKKSDGVIVGQTESSAPVNIGYGTAGRHLVGNGENLAYGLHKVSATEINIYCYDGSSWDVIASMPSEYIPVAVQYMDMIYVRN